MSSHFVCAKSGDQITKCFRMVVAAVTGIEMTKSEMQREAKVMKAGIVHTRTATSHSRRSRQRHKKSRSRSPRSAQSCDVPNPINTRRPACNWIHGSGGSGGAPPPGEHLALRATPLLTTQPNAPHACTCCLHRTPHPAPRHTRALCLPPHPPTPPVCPHCRARACTRTHARTTPRLAPTPFGFSP